MKNMSRPKIIILGLMCRMPYAGVVMQILHYMLGLERLGYETYYVEWKEYWIQDPTVSAGDPSIPQVVIGEVMRKYGFQDRWICRAEQVAPGYTFGGISHTELLKLYEDAEAIFNVCGSHVIEPEQLQCPRRLYLESDPGIPQIKLENGDPKMKRVVDGHTHHFTFGENIYNDDCLLPTGHIHYKPTRQPVLLDLWGSNPSTIGRSFTTISKWSKSKHDNSISFKGENYRWHKHTEFERFQDLPKLCDQSLELALSSISANDRQNLKSYGWNIIDAVPLSSSLEEYQSYIQNSRGEFTIAKDQYVRLNTGWFSDRSASYLAAGKPVVTQNTRFNRVMPTGNGLFAFDTMDDILAAFDAINSNYKKHSEAAREIAHEYFDSDKVLKNILDQIELEVV